MSLVYEAEYVFEKIDTYVSLIEFNFKYEQTQFSTNFGMEFYLRKITQDQSYRVKHLTSLIYDKDRLSYVCDDKMENMSSSEVFDSIDVRQCLSLSQIHQLLNEILASKEKCNCVVLENLDEAFNIASFENYITAGKLIGLITRILRKLSQLHKVTCLIIQQKPRVGFNVRHVSKLVKSMADNIILLNGNDIMMKCVYED